MNQIILADEINRATPRTQSSLLEAMAEKQITVDGETHKLKSPFFRYSDAKPSGNERDISSSRSTAGPIFYAVIYGIPKPFRRNGDLKKDSRLRIR